MKEKKVSLQELGIKEQVKPREIFSFLLMTTYYSVLSGSVRYLSRLEIEALLVHLDQQLLKNPTEAKGTFSVTHGLRKSMISYSSMGDHIFLDISRQLVPGLLERVKKTVVMKVQSISLRLVTWLLERTYSEKLVDLTQATEELETGQSQTSASELEEQGIDFGSTQKLNSITVLLAQARLRSGLRTLTIALIITCALVLFGFGLVLDIAFIKHF